MSTSKREEKETPRRGARTKKLSLKALESIYFKELKASVSEQVTSSDSEEDYEISTEIEKSSVLHQGESIEGNKIFSFQKRKMRNSLAQKVSEVRCQIPKTPHHVRNKLKQKIMANVLDSSSEDDFSGSGSEYVASGESESAESESSKSESTDASKEEDSDSDSTKNNKQSTKRRLQIKPARYLPVKEKGSKRRQTKKYVISTDDYFASHSSKKILTSNHTLDKLETPRLPPDQLKTIMEKLKLNKEHEKCLGKLCKINKAFFAKWFYLLHEGFNILLYGLGCKRHILKDFHKEYLADLPVIVLNGFFPTVSIKDLLDSIIVDLLELKENPSNVYQACDNIEQEFSYIPDVHLYVIVHNIEGATLRAKKSQDVLARLASIRNIHLIASIDHINAPLIWDHSKLSKFNYTWWDVTSFSPYIEETSFESSLLVQGTGGLALSSLRNVFLSLTTNSKGIYLIIVKHQLENAKDQYYQGLAFKDLYWSCREAFLVSSDLALRAQLTEFVDHKMVKYKRSVDGTEHLVIPIANVLLKKFLDEQQK